MKNVILSSAAIAVFATLSMSAFAGATSPEISALNATNHGCSVAVRYQNNSGQDLNIATLKLAAYTTDGTLLKNGKVRLSSIPPHHSAISKVTLDGVACKDVAKVAMNIENRCFIGGKTTEAGACETALIGSKADVTIR